MTNTIYEEYSLTLRHVMNCNGEQVNIDQPIVCKVVLDRNVAKNPTYVLNELLAQLEKFVYDMACKEGSMT